MSVAPETPPDPTAPAAGWTDEDVAHVRAWLRELERERGRPLRVLHFGNIANNAYLNAKFLREAGVDCHVLCADYYDPLATPEWEGVPAGERPRWFVQGPLRTCLEYLDALNTGTEGEQGRRWGRLQRRRWLHTAHAGVFLRILPRALKVAFYLRVLEAKLRYAALWTSSLVRFLTRKTLRLLGLKIAEPPLPDASGGEPTEFQLFVARQVARFAEVFPDRQDRLSAADFHAYEHVGGLLSPVLSQYDVVQAYSTDPILMLLAGVRPYVAYEHGTLRVFTLGDDPIHRLTALSYREAGHVFVTNGDCLEYAHRLGIEHFTPMVHPIDVAQYEQVAEGERAGIRARHGADVLLFCPLRHDWAIKGTDVHLRALPRILEETEGRTVLVLTQWGAEVDASLRLIAELGYADHVVWLQPLDRVGLISYLKAADVVLDQIALPHFGATAPQALAAGAPVVMSYRPESTAWIVDEPAPILPAFDPDGVVEAVRTALDPAWRAAFADEARSWVHRFHHPRRVVVEHCNVYRRLLEERE
jgi:hypothetical protein